MVAIERFIRTAAGAEKSDIHVSNQLKACEKSKKIEEVLDGK